MPDAQKRSDAAKGLKSSQKAKPSRGALNGESPLAPGALALAEQVILSERLDARLGEWQRRGQVGFFLPAGAWAAAFAGVSAALDSVDWLFPGMREARVALHRGMPLADYLAQHLGLEAGKLAPEASSAGHSQPGALGDVAHRVASTASGAASHLPHAVGAAMAASKLKTRGCAVALCGQAALDSADFHVAANFAGVFKAPVLFVVRAEPAVNGTRPGGDPVAARASAYGLEAATVAGGDAVTVRDAVRAALVTVRQGRAGLLVLEAPSEVGGAVPRGFPKLGASQLAGMVREADAACERAFATARDGVRPALPSLIRGVFADESRALTQELGDLMGEPLISPDEV